MKMLFKQRMFSWFDSYDVFTENGDTLFTVKGQLSWGHCFKIFDSMGRELGTVRQRIFSFQELMLSKRKSQEEKQVVRSRLLFWSGFANHRWRSG